MISFTYDETTFRYVIIITLHYEGDQNDLTFILSKNSLFEFICLVC